MHSTEMCAKILVLVFSMLLPLRASASSLIEVAGGCTMPLEWLAQEGAGAGCKTGNVHLFNGRQLCSGSHDIRFQNVRWPSPTAPGRVSVSLRSSADTPDVIHGGLLLLMAYDGDTGLLIPGDASGFYSLPQETEYFQGCLDASQAVTSQSSGSPVNSSREWSSGGSPAGSRRSLSQTQKTAPSNSDAAGVDDIVFEFEWYGEAVRPAFLASVLSSQGQLQVTAPACLDRSSSSCQADGTGCNTTDECPYPELRTPEAREPGSMVVAEVATWVSILFMVAMGSLLLLIPLVSLRGWLLTYRLFGKLPFPLWEFWYASDWSPLQRPRQSFATPAQSWRSIKTLLPALFRELTIDFFPSLWDITPAQAFCWVCYFSGQMYGAWFDRQALDGQPGLQAWSRAAGHLAQVNFGILLLPLCRNSPWDMLTGVSHERTLKYHRVILRYTVVLLVFHLSVSVQYFGSAAVAFRADVVGLGRGYGLLSFILLGVLSIMSHHYIRRNFYELFKYSFAVLYWLALAMACLHSTTMIYWVTPGLLFYMGDWIARMLTWRSFGAKKLTAAVINKDCVELQFAVAHEIKAPPGAFLYLSIAGMSRHPLDMHPFAISNISQPSAKYFYGDTPPSTVTLRVTAMGPGSWTRRLADKVSASEPLTARIEGPYCQLPIDIAQYSTVVVACAGRGIHPMLHIMQMFSNRRLRKQHLPKVTHLVVVWATPDLESASAFGSALSKARKASKSQLHVALFLTKMDTESSGQLWAKSPSKFQRDDRNGKQPMSTDLSTTMPSSELIVTSSQSCARDSSVSSSSSATHGAKDSFDIADGSLPFFPGRPNWQELYEEIYEQFSNPDLAGNGIASLIYGPRSMVRDVQRQCFKRGFHSHEEAFEV